MQAQETQQQTDTLIHIDLDNEQLVKIAVAKGEGELAANEALTVSTGARTGRSPKDRFIVSDERTKNTVDWGAINQPIEPEIFQSLWHKANQIIAEREHFIANLQVGADPKLHLPVKAITEYAWHNLFVKSLFIQPETIEDTTSELAPWTLLSVPSLSLDPQRDGVNSEGAVMINVSARKVLLCGMRYAGEMKKSMFSVMNFLMPEYDILPMHCAANMGDEGDVAVFFGLSGTGKTTLSADPSRHLIGDDEHGWGRQGIFNFEGGCYAKCINLSREKEPMIWNAIRFGTVMENVVLDSVTKLPKYEDDSLTQNTRAAYPREYIDECVPSNRGGQPNAVIFLCCDLFGVLPPVSILSKEQAAYYFLSGYTALVGSTEVGQTAAIKPTFSTCFGAPFFPRPAAVYAQLLLKRLNETHCPVYLVNTGWHGGAYGQGGKRYPIPTSRAIISAILQGALSEVDCEILPGFNLKIPTKIEGVDSKLLDPRREWPDKASYQANSKKLIDSFVENFKRFDVAHAIREAGPR